MVQSQDSASVQRRGPRGEGSVGFEKGRYVARFPLGNGRRKTFWSRPKAEGGTQAEAIAKRREWKADNVDPKTGKVKPEVLAAMSEGAITVQVAEPAEYTVGSWGTYWLDQLVRPLVEGGKRSPKTLESYTWAWAHVAARSLTHVKLADLSRPLIVRWWDEMTEAGVQLPTRHQAKVILGTALKAAVDRGYCASNFAQAYTPDERYEATEKPAPDRQATRDIRAQADGSRFELVLDLGWRLGLRRQEIAGLRYGDFDLARNEVTIRSRVQRVKGQGIVARGGVKMGGETSCKVKPLGKGPWAQLLHRQRQLNLAFAIQHQHHWRGPAAQSEAAWLFPNSYGQPNDPNETYRLFKGWARAAGHPEFTLHRMRHDFISTQLNSGMSTWEVAQLAGHADSHVTESIYGHRTDERLHQISGVADAWLDQGDEADAATG